MHNSLLIRLLALVVSLSVYSQSTLAGRVERAFREARESNRPLLAIGSSTFCQPCRELHEMLKSDTRLQKLVRQCVVLKVDSQSAEYTELTSRFAVDASKIPMVYIVLSDGTMMYGNVGKPSSSELQKLLAEAIDYSRPVTRSTSQVSSDLVSFKDSSLTGLLDKSRECARSGELIKAMRLLKPIAAMKDVGSEPVRRAQGYLAKLERAVELWLQDLDVQIESCKSIHGAIYRVAEVYVELSDVKRLRKQSGDMLKRYSKKEETKTAVVQAKHLLKARFHENRENCERAIENYREVVRVDSSSPAARYAANRIKLVQKKIAAKVAVQ